MKNFLLLAVLFAGLNLRAQSSPRLPVVNENLATALIPYLLVDEQNRDLEGCAYFVDHVRIVSTDDQRFQTLEHIFKFSVAELPQVLGAGLYVDAQVNGENKKFLLWVPRSRVLEPLRELKIALVIKDSSVPFELQLNQWAYYVDYAQGENQPVKRQWINNGGRNFTPQSSLENPQQNYWDRQNTSLGTFYKNLKFESPIFAKRRACR